MALYCGDRNSEATLTAFQDFKTKCLIEGKSLFTEKEVWTPDQVLELTVNFVENLDDHDGSFLEKLQNQLSDATTESKILASEMMLHILAQREHLFPHYVRIVVASYFN